MSEEMKFTLKKPLEFTKNGEFNETYELVFTAPSYNERKLARKIKQRLMRAMMDSQKRIPSSGASESASDSSELDPAAINVILLNGDQAFDDVVECFCSLAEGVCTLDDGVKIKSSHFKKIDPVETERMCCEYIAFFIAPSIFSMMSENSTSK